MSGWDKPTDMNSLVMTGWVAGKPRVKQGKTGKPFLTFYFSQREVFAGKLYNTSLVCICRQPYVIQWAEKALEKGHRIGINGRLSVKFYPDQKIPGTNVPLQVPYVQAFSITILHLSNHKPTNPPPGTHPGNMDKVEDLGLNIPKDYTPSPEPLPDDDPIW